MQGDALALPFPTEAFDRVFTGHFYGHLDEDERGRFLAEARRVAPRARGRRCRSRPDSDVDESAARAS